MWQNQFRFFEFQESISNLARQFKNNKKTSQKEKYKVAQGIHERLKNIGEDVSIKTRKTFESIIKSSKPIFHDKYHFLHEWIVTHSIKIYSPYRNMTIFFVVVWENYAILCVFDNPKLP